MFVVLENLSRREVVKRYVEYDARKKGTLMPADIDEWDWNDPNAIDEKLELNTFKPGVIAGFRQWDLVQLSRDDLLQCAIVNSIEEFAGLQVLGCLFLHPKFKDWKPVCPKSWYESLETGKPFPPEWAMILRPAVSSESPAKWYIEDGSGRAICFLRRLMRHEDDKSLAYGYLGKNPDHSSKFMQCHFRELLK